MCLREAGESIPVTVIEALPNRVTRIKSDDADGYRAVQVTVGLGKALPNHQGPGWPVCQGGYGARRRALGVRLSGDEGDELAPGAELKVELFEAGQVVDVSGVSKGKGFAGTVKRHNFRTQDASHGNSLSHRVPGSIGQNQTPGRVFKGKKMAGHMGNVNRTATNLEVVRVDADRNLILVKGGVPGAAGGRLIIRPAVKAS